VVIAAALTLGLALLVAVPAAAPAAELDGVVLPDRLEAAGRTLALNGMATRTYSVFRVKVYVAGLYLERPSRDAAEVLASPEPKVVLVRYLRSVGREDAAAAWAHFLRANCVPPCRFPEDAAARFAATLEPVAAGETMDLVVADGAVEVVANGRSKGVVRDALFSRLLLATWIGRAPTSEAVKRGLLAGRPPD
jgi:hypothetical protein